MLLDSVRQSSDATDTLKVWALANPDASIEDAYKEDTIKGAIHTQHNRTLQVHLTAILFLLNKNQIY